MADVWVLAIERGLDVGADIRVFWSRDEAHRAAQSYLAEVWSGGRIPGDLDDAIEAHNSSSVGSEHVYVGRLAVEGERPRCVICGEPSVLAEETDPVSWVHAEDADDGGDHTAESRSETTGPPEIA